MKSFCILGAALAMVVAGCAHDGEGHRIRTGNIRFDAQSVTGPGLIISRNSDGTWGAFRVEKVGNQIRGGFWGALGFYGWVEVETLPDGIKYTPSSYWGPIWTFITADGKPLPADLEIPLWLAAGYGLGGQWVTIRTPGSEVAGVDLRPNCSLVLFDLGERQVAGWVAGQGAVCPEPRYPGRDALARLVEYRNEVWESPLRTAP